jgi:hypothetical protein
MKQGTPNVRTAAKDILARLLASEDLTVQHDAQAETASFDTQNRVLRLPVWQDMDNEMYDMLVGHEVSHALYTPADGWQGFVGDDQYSPLRHMCLNVCEDVRIERKIKSKFPGLRRDFAKAYKSLHERDIFELKDKSVDDLPLIDRLNLYYKGEIYGQMTVPFTADERKWLTRLDAADTFESIMEVASDLFDVTKEEKDQKDQEQQEASATSKGVGEGEGSSDSQAGESDDSAEGEGVGTAGAGDEQGEDSGQSADDDTDDGESADSQQGEQSSQSGHDLSYESYSEGVSPGSTQRNYEQARDDMRSDDDTQYNYYDLPECDLNKIIISHERIASVWESYWALNATQLVDYRTNSAIQLRDFQNRSKPIVAHMVQQFQQKQAADASKRSNVAKTGMLDTTTMINYRWSEDIFLKNEVHSDGKSHGIVIFIDWSGSMHSILKDTVEQLLVLVEFCRKAGIPYEVHAFTSNPFSDYVGPNYDPRSRQADDDAHAATIGQFIVTENSLSPHTFQLLNFLSGKMNARQHGAAVKNLYYLAGESYRAPRCLGLGCTPLNEAILAGLDIVPTFQRDNDVQIANVVLLTDGDGHSIMGQYGYRGKNFIQDPKTHKTYSTEGRDTDALVQVLKDRTGCNVISIRLHDSANIKMLRYRYFGGSDYTVANKRFEDAVTSYKKNHFFITESTCDLSIVVKGNLKVETDPLEDLDDNASNTRIRNAFIRGGNRKKSSRVIANRLVDIIAVH